MWYFGYSIFHIHVVSALKYICSSTGEKGSKCEASVKGIAMEGGCH
jgi:hypothetical protein